MNPDFATTLRRAIIASGKTQEQLAAESGVTQSVISRFLASGAGVGVRSFERLARAVGLELRARK